MKTFFKPIGLRSARPKKQQSAILNFQKASYESLILEPLEPRVAPAGLYAVDTSNNLLHFDSEAPGAIVSTVPITGMVTGDDIVAIDFRPATGELYALADGSRLYKVDLETGATTQIGTQMSTLLSGTSFGFDFSPTSDMARITSNIGQNLRVNPDTLAVSVDTVLNGDTTALVASAYINNYANAQSTLLYGLNSATDSLYLQTNPNGGTLNTVGPLGIDFNELTGFDVANASATAYAALTAGGTTGLYTINLLTGAATSIGSIGNGAISLVGLAAAMPTVTIVNDQMATYTDADGDVVTVKTTVGAFHSADFQLAAGPNGGGTLRFVGLADDGTEFAGASLKISVKKSPTGDGLTQIGWISANGIDLNKISIKGDLGQLTVGDGDAATTGLKSLKVDSIGRYGLSTQGTFGALQVIVFGDLDSLIVKNDVVDTAIFVVSGALDTVKIGGNLIGGNTGNAGAIVALSFDSVTIGEDILGGAGTNSGMIYAQGGGAITKINVGGNIIGGTGDFSGMVFAEGALTSAVIKGDLIGGSGVNSGRLAAQSGMESAIIDGDIIGGAGQNSGNLRVTSGDVGKIQVGGDVQGAEGNNSGLVFVFDDLGSIKVKGSVLGGAGSGSGEIFVQDETVKAQIGGDVRGGNGTISGNLQLQGGVKSLTVKGSLIGGTADDTGVIYFPGGSIENLTIKHNLVGGSISGADSLTSSGKIEGSHVGKLSLGGSIYSGVDGSTGTLQKSGGVYIYHNIENLSVKGSLVGNSTNAVALVTRGQETPAPDIDLALGSLTIGGFVQYANILAGYDGSNPDPLSDPINGNAQIGKISVGDNWIASSISAGIRDVDGDGFGDGDDEVINNLFDGIISRIASIVIKGTIFGSATSGDNFGFVAQKIGSFQVGGHKLALASGAENDIVPLALVTNDVTMREVTIV